MFNFEEYMGKPFEWNGNGNPGYDCVSLVVAVLERLHGYYITYPERGSHNIHIKELPKTMMKHLSRYLQRIKTFDYIIGDVFIYTIHKAPCHLGIYIGGGKILMAVETKGVTTFSTEDEIWYKRLTGVYRWQ